MARATFVNKSQKAIPESACGIKGGIPKGSSYYWWKFRRGGKRFSLTPPRRSQLTQSAFYGAIFDFEDSDIANCEHTHDAVSTLLDNAKDFLENLKDEAQGNLDNLPQELQESHMLNERIENIESAISELESVSLPDEDGSDEDFEAAIEEISNALGNLS